MNKKQYKLVIGVMIVIVALFLPMEMLIRFETFIVLLCVFYFMHKKNGDGKYSKLD